MSRSRKTRKHAWRNTHRHAWAVIERRAKTFGSFVDRFLGLVREDRGWEVRILSTHKTPGAARAAAPTVGGRLIGIVPSSIIPDLRDRLGNQLPGTDWVRYRRVEKRR